MAKKQTKKQSIKLQPLHIVLIAVAALALIIGGVVLAAVVAILLFVFVFNDKGEGYHD